jgi:endonuclease/exonuclease/phosphatase family metal-dependent hydrolase
VKAVAITVLVLNMHAGQDGKLNDNLGRVAALIRATQADIVLLQEVDRGTRRSHHVDQPAVLERLTRLRAAFGRTLDYDGGTYGIASMARGAIEGRVRPLRVDPPQARAGGSTEPRGVLIADVQLPQTAIVIANTHLDASREDRYRLQEVDDLIAALAERAAGPLVVGGDFNSTPESETHARMLRAGYTDAWTACGKGPDLTYPADAPIKRIDYLFLASGVRCTSAEVLPFQGSDHRPLLVRLLIDRK